MRNLVSGPWLPLIFGVLCGLTTASYAAAQASADAACTLAAPSFASSAPNIFNAQQEQDLGDALAEYFESDLRLAPPAQDDRLKSIGERLLAALPPTGLQYRFRVYDSGDVNGFSFAGGRIYISRKLIAATKTEDDLAGVVAHEIGHLATHQTAIEITRTFRIRMGITQVTDRADIFAKVHQMFKTPVKPAEEEDVEQKDQLIADRVALFAMQRAGYSVESFASFLNESMMNKGKTGNWFTDFFGANHEASQRYRSALKLIAALPAGCKGHPPTNSAAYASWQKSMVEERVQGLARGVTGDRPIKLDPPLRPSLWRIRFSPDGRYVLAQDEGSISIIDRVAAKVLFRIDAPETEGAQFTPDSQNIVFHDSKLRIEQWSIAAAKRTSVKEMVVYDGCTQTLLSSDAKTLVCLSVPSHGGYLSISLRLFDVESGKVFYEKPAFFEPNLSDQGNDFLLSLERALGLHVASAVISPDGRFLVVAARGSVLAYDLQQRRPIALGGKLRDLYQSRFAFLGSDQFYVVGEAKGKDLYQARILSFPDGKLLKETIIGDQEIEAVSKGQFLIASPLKDYAAAILDPNQGKFMGASKLPAIDEWSPFIAIEDASGGVRIGEAGAPNATRIMLPIGPLPPLRAVTISADGKYLAASSRNRAGVWDLTTGSRIQLIRPFRSAWMNDADRLVGQFPKFLESELTELEITMSPFAAYDLAKYDDDELQYRNLRIHFKPMGSGKATNHHAVLEVKKMDGGAVAWSREFPRDTPACWPAEDNRLILAWDLGNDGVKSELKNFPALQHELDALKGQKRGLLLETVVLDTGAPLQQVILPEADLTNGFADERHAWISGQYVFSAGEHDTTTIYRLEDGSKVAEFFGRTIASDATSGLIAATNREDEIFILEEKTGKELSRFNLGSPMRAARILPGQEHLLLVLTADQIMHRLPLPQ